MQQLQSSEGQLQAHRVDTSSSSSPSPMSLVSRAKTAFHSAAAKAEKVITEIKADLKSDRGDSEGGQSLKGSRRGSEVEVDLVDRVDSSSKPNEEVLERDSSCEEIGARASTSSKLTVPPASVIKQLATAFETGKNLNSINEFSALDEDPLSIKEKTSLKFSVVKSIVRREKEDKPSSKSSSEDEFHCLIRTLFDSEEQSSLERNDSDSGSISMVYLQKDIPGAPPQSFVVRLSEIMGRFKSMQKMALFWGHVVVEFRRLWTERKPIPHIPLDTKPDLNACHLHQQLQAINCCIARKHRRYIATESLDSVLKDVSLDNNDSVDVQGKHSSTNKIYARTNSGKYILRLGADHPSEGLTMLETGEPVYSPVLQEGPVLTEELIRETEEFVLRTGSVGAGCSQLLSDMQAFKAANPGCVLEDFIRWHSPPDWTEMEADDQANDSADGEGSSRRGRLSARMQKEGNLWREFWESAKPLPAIKQVPLYDEDLAVDSILNALEDIQPGDLFEQLFISVLCSSFLIAGAALPLDSELSKLFNECKDYVTATCQTGILSGNIRHICKVYETVEMMVVHPKEAIRIVDQQEETVSGESKGRFKKINLTFIRKDMPSLRRKASKDEKIDSMEEKTEKGSDEKNTHVFSQLFDKSLFSRKQSKSNLIPSPEPESLDGSDWTIV